MCSHEMRAVPVQQQAGVELTSEVLVHGVPRLAHLQPRRLAILLAVQGEVLIARQPQAFTATGVAVLVHLSSYQDEDAFPTGDICKPLRNGAKVLFLRIPWRLPADQLEIIKDDAFDVPGGNGSANHRSNVIQTCTG